MVQFTKTHFIFALITAFIIVTVSSMAIHLANTDASDSYRNTVIGIASVALVFAAIVLIVGPILIVDKNNRGVISILAIGGILSILVISISGMSIHEAVTPSTSKSYKDTVKVVAGTSLGGAAAAVIALPIIYYYVSKRPQAKGSYVQQKYGQIKQFFSRQKN